MNCIFCIDYKVNNIENNFKTNKYPCFKAKKLPPEIIDSFIKLSPENRKNVLGRISETLGFSIASLISFFGLEKLINEEPVKDNIPKEEFKTSDFLKKDDDSFISYKKENVTFFEYWYDASNRSNISIKEIEQFLIIDFIDKNISNNPKFKNLDIVISIHMPKGKVFFKYKQKNDRNLDNYKFIEGTYNNGLINIDLNKVL